MTTSKRPGKNPYAAMPRRCDIAMHAVMAGMQEVRVDPFTAAMSVTGSGYLSLRVGRCILLLEDREALLSWITAMTRAELHSPKVFGPSPARQLATLRQRVS